MNENLNLVEILKDCPRGTKLYSPIFGEVKFEEINDNNKKGKFTIVVYAFNLHLFANFTKRGFYFEGTGECTLFPSKEQRDWSKFTAPWYKKDRFDPKTLRPYDRVLARDTKNSIWRGTLFSHYNKNNEIFYPFITVGGAFGLCIPYNEDTKHLLGTSEEAPEYYCYWED